MTWADLGCWAGEPDDATLAAIRVYRDGALFAGTPTWTRVRCAPGDGPGSLERLRSQCGRAVNHERIGALDENPAAAFTNLADLVNLKAVDPKDDGSDGRWVEDRGAWFGWRHGRGYMLKAFTPQAWPCERAEPASVLLAAIVRVAADRVGGRAEAPASNRHDPRKQAPTFHDPALAAGCVGEGWVVDIRKAYGQLSFPMGWDLRYQRAGGLVLLGAHPWWGCDVWGRDKALVQRVLGLTESGAYAAPDLRDWRMDCLAAIATVAVDEFSAVHWNSLVVEPHLDRTSGGSRDGQLGVCQRGREVFDGGRVHVECTYTRSRHHPSFGIRVYPNTERSP